MKTFMFLALVSFVSFANAQVPTLADADSATMTSVLATPTTTATADTQQPAAQATTAPTPCSAPCVGCCETAKEVRLLPWQARRLSRQAERQEARDCRDCCKSNSCCDNKDCRPTAVVTVRNRCRCCN